MSRHRIKRPVIADGGLLPSPQFSNPMNLARRKADASRLLAKITDDTLRKALWNQRAQEWDMLADETDKLQLSFS